MRYVVLTLSAFALVGCSSLQGADVATKALDNLEYCQRDYTGGIGAGVTLSVDISCPPRPYPVTPTPE